MENTWCHLGNIYAGILIFANANVALTGKREIIYNNLGIILCRYFNFLPKMGKEKLFIIIYANANIA